MMPRRNGSWVWALTVLAVLAVTDTTWAQSAPTTKTQTEMRFLQGLRERGYNDLILEYIDKLRQQPDTPADLKILLDYEEGRCLVEEASQAALPIQKRELLEKARTKIEDFAKNHSTHKLVPEALVQLARLYFERAQAAVQQATDAETPAEKEVRLTEARASFAAARDAYDRAMKPLKTAFESYPKFIPDDDPRKEERDRFHDALMNAELQRTLVDYEEAQTYPADAPKRSELLEKARVDFEEVYKRYRTQLAGFFARMWQAKCYEEKGQLGEAMGIYKELMDHPDPALRPLQRQVQYFQIIVDGKRGEHALAVDRASAWLQMFPNAHNTPEGVGVRFQLAKNILAQLDTMNETNRPVAIRRSTDLLEDVVRYYSPFKEEAVALLQKYRPEGAANLNRIASLSYEDAYAQAESAISTHEWERAVLLLQQAVRRADPRKDTEKANRARYLMSYCYYEAEKYYTADVLAEHIARHYPKDELAPKATEIGMAALTFAYNTFSDIDRAADLDRLIALAEYTAKTWPDSDQGDAARVTLGEINLGRGDYAKAAEYFEGVRATSSRRLDAQVKAGDARWRHAGELRDENKTVDADAEVQKALDLLETALKARQDANVPITNPSYITNANALAEVHRASGRPTEALALIEPITKALAAAQASSDLAPLQISLLTTQLRSHIAAGQSEKAIADMKALEAVGGAGDMLTQLYYELGRTLKSEVEAEEGKAYTTQLNATRKAYGEFLQALANSKSGQTYDSLMFAGESLLSIGKPAEALPIFDRVLQTYSKDQNFLKAEGATDRLLRAELRKAEALRKLGKFPEAETLLTKIREENPRMLEPILEQGYLQEDWAKTDPSHWKKAYDHWKWLSGQLSRSRPRPVQYYDALYHVALALQGMKQPRSASQTLKSIMTLTPDVGSPEMKAKYETLLQELNR